MASITTDGCQWVYYRVVPERLTMLRDALAPQ
jgi:hypothetical protein